MLNRNASNLEKITVLLCITSSTDQEASKDMYTHARKNNAYSYSHSHKIHIFHAHVPCVFTPPFLCEQIYTESEEDKERVLHQETWQITTTKKCTCRVLPDVDMKLAICCDLFVSGSAARLRNVKREALQRQK